MRPDELMARCAASGIDLITIFQQSVPEGQERAQRNYHGPIQKQTHAIRRPEWSAEDAAGACQGLDQRLYAAFAFRFAGDQSQRGTLRSGLLAKARHFAKRDNWKLVRQCANCEATGIVHEFVRDPHTGKAIGRPGSWETRPVPCPICRSFGKVLGRGQQLLRGAGQVVVVEQLVDLAIFEEWLTVHYVTGLLELAQHKAWPHLIGIDPEDWERTVFHQYRAVQCVIDRWCGIAYGHIQERIRDDEAHVA